MAIYLAFNASATIFGLSGLQLSWVFIGLAALFDFCDGAAARLLKAYSDLGKELDSLSDLVSFGVAPAMILLNTLTLTGGWSAWYLSVLLIPVFGALRLARFNIDTTGGTASFRGMPIPANALFWVGVSGFIIDHGTAQPWVMALIIVAFSGLMISRMKMFSLKFHNFDWRENFRRYVIILAAILFVLSQGVAGLAWTILLYLLISAVGRKEV